MVWVLTPPQADNISEFLSYLQRYDLSIYLGVTVRTEWNTNRKDLCKVQTVLFTLWPALPSAVLSQEAKKRGKRVKRILDNHSNLSYQVSRPHGGGVVRTMWLGKGKEGRAFQSPRSNSHQVPWLGPSKIPQQKVHTLIPQNLWLGYLTWQKGLCGCS